MAARMPVTPGVESLEMCAWQAKCLLSAIVSIDPDPKDAYGSMYAVELQDALYAIKKLLEIGLDGPAKAGGTGRLNTEPPLKPAQSLGLKSL